MHLFLRNVLFAYRILYYLASTRNYRLLSRTGNSGNVLVISPILCNCDEFTHAFFLLLLRKFLFARTVGFAGESRVVSR